MVRAIQARQVVVSEAENPITAFIQSNSIHTLLPIRRHLLRFASFDMLRRLSLTSLLLLFDSSLVQIQVAFLLSWAGIVVTQEAAPHWTPVADRGQYGE